MKMYFSKYFKLVVFGILDVILSQQHQHETHKYLFTAIMGLQFTDVGSWNLLGFGEDCEPVWKKDSYLMNMISKSEAFIEDFGNETNIDTILSSDWTREMEAHYVELIISMGTTCNAMELLNCNLKWNANKDFMAKHHHHTEGTHGLAGESILEDRNGILVISSNETGTTETPETGFQSIVLEFDPRLEGRCTCNPDYSIHHTTEVVKDGTKQLSHKCLGLIGTPCAYFPRFMDFSYLPLASTIPDKFPIINRNPLTCIPGSKCLSIKDRIMWDEVHHEPKGLDHRTDDIHDVIEDTLGYRFTIPGMRPAYLNYVLQFASHLCQCKPGYKAAGNKECVPDDIVLEPDQPEPRSVEGDESGSELGKSLPVKVIVIIVAIINMH